MTRSTHRPRLFLLSLLTAITAAAAGSASASAAEPEPHIRVELYAADHVTPGAAMSLHVAVTNDGDAPMSGNLTIDYSFPVGVEISEPDPETISGPSPTCVQAGQVDECTLDVTGIPPDQAIVYKTLAFVEHTASGVLHGQVDVAGGGAPNAASAPFSPDTAPIGPFAIKSFAVDMGETADLPASQAAGHPTEIAASFETYSTAFSTFGIPFFTEPVSLEGFRDVITHVPAGLVGNPNYSGAKCTAENLVHFENGTQNPNCPRDSQIGIYRIDKGDVGPVYNLIPPAGIPAEFALVYQGVVVRLDAKLRPTDNGIDIVNQDAPSSVPLPKFELALWGTPADSTHDDLRAECMTGLLNGAGGALCPSLAPKTPFLRMPTSCTGDLLWEIEMDTYQHPGVMHRKSTTTPALSGCDRVPFEPKIALAPTDSSAHSTSGLSVDLRVPQDSAPNGIASADVRQVSLTLPHGVGLNPAAAEGLEACSDTQLRLGLEGPAECPDASKLGAVEIDTPLLEETLDGSVYLRTQSSQDPESGEMYRLAIVLHSAERGVDVKLPGSLVVNKETGQLTTTFDELPQLPFETMHLHLKAGPRAPLTTPQNCGQYAAQATLVGWNGKTVTTQPGFTIDQGCNAPGFAPGFQAGVSDPKAGAFSPFTLRVTRGSGMPNLSRIQATLPEGELAKLRGVPLCGEAQAATGACPASSRIGKVTTAAGEGASPIYLPQPGKSPTALYLAGPYKSAPYSVLASVPAQSGPFDLGTVLVRSALRIDPETTRVTVVSDPLPQIFGGIPIAYRDVRVEVDRPKFTINPTDCEPKAVHGTLAAATGQSAQVSDRFQVGDCAALGFRPKLSISLAGKTRRAGSPALTAVVTYPKKGDYANIARTSVALPASEFLAQEHIRTVCTRVQFNAGAGGGAECPKGSVYGKARAFSPLLDRPLQGPVYLRANGGERELPDLVAALDGQIHVDLVGYIDTNPKTGGIRTTFAKVPDAPVSKFVLKMPAGEKSLLSNSTNICRSEHRAIVKMDGQNGRVHDFRPLVRARCGSGAQRGH